MKIKQLRLKNFGQFEDFELQFNDGVTNLVGINGSGKTTVGLTAIWAGFKGIAERSTTGHLIGERYRFICEGKRSLDIEIMLHDESNGRDIKLTRHITKSTNTIKIELSNGEPMSREYVENLLNVSFLSASHFAALTGQQQAEAMGINTGMFDARLSEVRDRAKEVRASIKAIGTLKPVSKAEPIDIESLQNHRAEAVKFNQDQSDRVECIKAWNGCIRDHEAIIQKAQDQIAALIADIKGLPKEEELEDIEAIDEEIKNIVETNTQAAKYNVYLIDKENLAELDTELGKNKESQSQIQTDRNEYLKSKSFGIPGLQIDDDGNLTKDGKLIRCPYFSKGELEMLVARISSNLNPELKVRFIDDFELLDDVNQEKIIKNLTKRGFQIITAQVGSKPKGDNSVLLKACKVADDTREGVTNDPDFELGTGKIHMEDCTDEEREANMDEGDDEDDFI